MPPSKYRDRADAGRQLAGLLKPIARPDMPGAIVLGLPRGGVVTAAAVAEELGLPLDVLAARKLGAPGQPELAAGAIAENGVALINQQTVAMLDIPESYLKAEAARQRAELERQVKEYRGGRDLPPLEGRTVILVDDGIATGLTTLAAALAVLNAKPAELIVAAPVAAPDAVRLLERNGARVVCPYAPANLGAVGAAYDNFTQVNDDEVKELLTAARRRTEERPAA